MAKDQPKKPARKKKRKATKTVTIVGEVTPRRVKKSGPKSVVGSGRTQFKKGTDARRGRGPKAGAANAGRPPSVTRDLCLVSFTKRIKVLEKIADNPKSAPADRIRAVDLLGKYSGLGAQPEDAPPSQISVIVMAGAQIVASHGGPS